MNLKWRAFHADDMISLFTHYEVALS